MAKIKVHELAKELDKQSKEVLAFLQEKGIEAKAAQSSIEESAAELVRKHFKTGEQTQAVTGKEEKKATPETAKAQEASKALESAKVTEPVKTSETQKLEPKAEEKSGDKTEEAPKKKKKIIFVSNPQNSKMPGQRPGNGQGRQNPNQARPGNPMCPAGGLIRPTIPPSPAPAVNMVPSTPKPSPKKEVRQEERTVEKPVQRTGDRPVERPERTTERPADRTGDRSQDRNTDRRDFRDGAQRQNQNQRGQQNFQRRPENGGRFGDRNTSGYDRGARPGNNNGRPSQDGRPNAGNGQGNWRNNGSNAGARGTFGNQDRPGRPNAGTGNKFGNRPAAKGFAAEAPGKDVEKHREDEKRRINSQDKDKRSKKDMLYEEDNDKVKNKPGRFIKPEKKKEEPEEVIKVITIPESITIKDLADKMKIQPSAIVKKLFLQGKIVTVNQEISFEDAENIAIDYEIICEKEQKVDVIEELLKEEDEKEEDMVTRAPVICVMGHVDHGKTSLLDAIRKTNVTDREAGGITQHIGAYTVSINGQKITFLDTPGHEAFTAMRMRGANATDIAILVVAADDGVMPQTVEAINHAKAAGIEIIVAVNKIDKPNANIDKVKQELAEYELIPEDWGGSTVFAPVSAKSGEGIEQLLELILLTAEILELKANPNRRARGIVIEAELDKGRGPVATVLVQKGTLRVGDFISAGASHGKVRAMIDDKGRRVKEAEPSTPVEILGLNDVPNAGEVFIAHENDKTAKYYAETFVAQNKEKMLEETRSRMSLDDLFSQIQAGNLKELNLIVKADVQGSVEAVKQSLLKLSNEEVVVKCIHGGVGAINESDVSLASASDAIIIGFNVRPDATAKAIAEREGVDIRLYKVIYQAIEDIEAAMKGMLDPVYEEKVIGHAEVRQIFKASAVGNIAGAYVLDGTFQRGCKVRITREGEQIYEGQLASLKRFKDDVKEVKAGFECGLVFEGFDQMQELDIVEAYIMVEVPR